MRRRSSLTRIALVVLGLTLMGASLARTERRKAFVDPLLGRMIRASEKAARDTGRPEAIPADEMASFARRAAVDDGAGDPVVGIRLRLDHSARQSIERLGVRTYGRLDGFASALAPIRLLKAIAALSGVESVHALRIPELELDVSRAEVLSTQVQTTYASRGRGVIVGSVDTGIDWRHQDFRKPDGTTRIKYIWSQDDSCTGTPPAPPFGFGCLYTEAQINAALTGGPTITAPDADGHGTHTIGVAAGSGRATGQGYPAERYVGMAPEADIIVVKYTPEPGDPDCGTCYNTALGIEFIDAKAAELGKPYVINLSYGLQYGGHDAGDIEEMTIDALTGPGIPGKAIVKSAGNDRGKSIHVGGTVSAGQTVTHNITIPSYTALPGTLNDAVAWSVWYSAGDHMTVTIADPATAACGLTEETLSVTTGQADFFFRNLSSGRMVIDNLSSPAPNGAEFFDMEIDDGQATAIPPCPGVWKLRVQGNTITAGGRYDAWIWFNSFGAAPAKASWQAPDLTRLVTVPGTALHVTTVGGYTTKYEWLSRNGSMVHFDGTFLSDIGKLSSFSSPGPTRDGRLKPDLTGPASAIVSTLSLEVPVNAQTTPLIVEDRVHMAQMGTSFSAPHIAGIYAQILALNPNLDAIDLRTLATLTGRVDANVTPVPNNDWGYGKVSAIGMANRAAQNIPDVTASAAGTFTWTALPTATTYNVYRGNVLLKGPGYYGSCYASGLVSPSFNDNTPLVPDAGFFYHVTGVWNGIEGSLGFTSDGLARVNGSPCP